MRGYFTTFMLFLANFTTCLVARDKIPESHYHNSDNNSIVVKTSNGLVRGKLMQTFNENKEYQAFFKIPFAKPPIEHRRFEAPEPADPWNGIYDATNEGDQCVQYSSNNTVVGSEDCLFLRVYAPKQNSTDDDLLAVIYYVHGGGFVEGSPNFNEYGPDLFMEKGVVLAFVQYRLGFYGFLSTEDAACPGNNGLKDQRLGLKWIKENAKAFGGDPDKITIVGHSAGAVSVGYLLNTPTTAGLFRAAIQQSAVEIAYVGTQKQARKKAFVVGQQLGISTNNSEDLIEKLKKIEYKRLFDAASTPSIEENGSIAKYCPLIEPDHPEAVVTQKPLQQIQNGDYNRVPIMIGFTSLEAFTLSFPDAKKNRIKSDIISLVPNTIVPVDDATKLSIAKEIKEHYFGRDDFSHSLLRYLSDDIFVRPIQQKSRIISAWSPTYMYKFCYVGVLGNPSNPIRRGAGHAEELWYMFHKTNEPESVPESDTRLRLQLVAMWTDFVKTLNPTPTEQTLLDNVSWPLFSEETDYQSLSINNKLSIVKRVDETDLRFWQKMFSYDKAHVGWY